MTINELSQLYHLNREIPELQRQLDELKRKAEGLKATNYSGMPKGGGTGRGSVEQYAAEIADLEAIISAKQIQCIHEYNRLQRWISSIPDSVTRRIFTLRFVNGYNWHQVAVHVGGNNTEQGVKKRMYRYLDEINGKKRVHKCPD